MREIKFRAWIKKTKRYTYNIQNEYDGCYDTENIEQSFAHYLKSDKYIVEQYTGLSDTNGVEIYDGDILEKEYDNHSSTVGTIKYDAPTFYVDTRDDLLSDNFKFDEFYKRKVKVIGNINE